MTVIINELEQLPASTAAPPASRGGTGSEGSAQNGARAMQPGQFMTLIRREASRQSRLWAD
jgi:hypothetical protein